MDQHQHNIGPTPRVYWGSTRDVQPMLVQCRPIVFDARPTLYRHWLNVSCLLGRMLCPRIPRSLTVNEIATYTSSGLSNPLMSQSHAAYRWLFRPGSVTLIYWLRPLLPEHALSTGDSSADKDHEHKTIPPSTVLWSHKLPACIVCEMGRVLVIIATKSH